MGNLYQGISGQCYVLKDTTIARGGEGSIHEIAGNAFQAAKLFKPEKRTAEREEKLCCMVKTKLDAKQLEQVTWPQDVIYDRNGFAGYIMPRLKSTESLTAIYSTGQKQYDLRDRLLAAINLCHAMETVHNMGQVCGDLNPLNICLNLDEGDRNAFHVTLVDTDSYHFISGEKTFRCEVGLGDYIAPELQRKLSGGLTFRNAPLPTYTRETDLFALAVHIFVLLMNGCHPFACAKENNGALEHTMPQMDGTSVRDSVVAPQPIENILEGFFPFFEKRAGITYPIYAPSFSALPERLRSLFVRTFVNGYADPSQRVGTGEWIDALMISAKEIVNCTKNKGHYYFSHNMKCPLCEVDERIIDIILKELIKEKKGDGSGEGEEDDPDNEEEGETETGGGGETGGDPGDPIDLIKLLRYPPIPWKYLVLMFGVMLFIALVSAAIEYEKTGSKYKTDRTYYEEEQDESMATQPPANSNMENSIVTQSPGDSANENDGTNNSEEIERQKKEKQRREIAQKKRENAQLRYGNKIKACIKKKHYATALRYIKKGKKKSYFKGVKKINIKNGKLASSIDKGKGFVFYVKEKYAYIGELKKGRANGSGKEMGDPVSTAYGGYYTVKGIFKNGYPNGKCTVHYSREEKNNAATYIGTYRNGWENGSFVWVDKSLNGGHSDTYYFSSKRGKRKVIEKYKGAYVYAKAKSGWFHYVGSKDDLYDYGYTTEHYGDR